MKISSKILSIPPYLSTSWKNVASIQVQEQGGAYEMTIALHTRQQVVVPGLSRVQIDAIFAAHARHLEGDRGLKPMHFAFPFGKIDTVFNESMQHNPEQGNSPNLPREFLDKIKGVLRALGAEATEALPKAEPHCNCTYCQIVRAVHGEELPAGLDEPVTDEDLQFRTWDVTQTADKLYTVSNPLDEKEQYSVFLGEPLGCTCGHKNCEHIRAVLNT